MPIAVRTLTATGGNLTGEEHTFGSGFQAYRDAINASGAIYSNYIAFGGAGPFYYCGYNSSDGTYDIQRVIDGLGRNQTNLGTPPYGPSLFAPNGDGTFAYQGPLLLDIEGGNVELVGSNETYASDLSDFVDDLVVALPDADVYVERILCSPSNNSSPASNPTIPTQTITTTLGHACPNLYANTSGTRDLAWMKSAIEFGIEYSGNDIAVSVSLNRTSGYQNPNDPPGSGWDDLDGVNFVPSDTYWQNILEACQHTYNGHGVKLVWCYGDSITRKGSDPTDLQPYSYSQLIEAEIVLIQSLVNTLAPRTTDVLA